MLGQISNSKNRTLYLKLQENFIWPATNWEDWQELTEVPKIKATLIPKEL